MLGGGGGNGSSDCEWSPGPGPCCGSGGSECHSYIDRWWWWSCGSRRD